MKRLPHSQERKLALLALLIAQAVLWIVPSNVLKLVAREQHVLLGRYSRTHFGWIIGVAVVTMALAPILLAGEARAVRRRSFALIACLLVFVPSAFVADLLLRLRTSYPYVPDRVVYHRPPNAKYELEYVDQPEVHRSYPARRPGFGRVACKLTYDAAGYRNAGVPATCDLVAVGDSFTEGSRVSDDQCWPARLASLNSQTVYNLGTSGYSPPEYLAALKAYGLGKKPRFVLCMLYEGNDFRSTSLEVKSGITIRQWIKTSPLLMTFNQWLIDTLGPINTDGPFRGSDVLSWMPFQVPSGPEGKYYAFAPKQILELSVSKDEFDGSPQWFAAKGLLRELNATCALAGSKMVIVYAPNKGHVVFPLAADHLPAEKVRAYAALRSQQPLPEPAEFMRQTLEELGSREEVIAAWCQRQGIPFVSLTPAMRAAAAAGQQVYYTYDQHWTPVGHEVAARTIGAFCRSGLAASDDRGKIGVAAQPHGLASGLGR
jgi:hypothetical protein